MVWGCVIYSIDATKIACQPGNHLLFNPISFQAQSGELIIVEGPNGIGKSSLLRVCAGLAVARSGCLHWCGRSLNQTATLRDYQKHLHYISHQNGLKMQLSVIENIKLTCALLDLDDLPTTSFMFNESYAHSLSLITTLTKHLQQLDLYSLRDTPAYQLSAGQKRRLALLKCLLFPKPIWILDEPFTSLDVKSQSLFLDEFVKHLQQGGIIMMSSHHPIHVPHQKRICLQAVQA